MNHIIATIKEKGLPTVKSGNADNISDFFNQIIKDQFSDKEAIKAIHKALLSYINRNDAVFILRLYGSAPKKRYELLRRGFLTDYPDGRKMVFCDNTFVMPFMAMKLEGMTYNESDLLAFMADPSLRCGFGSTKEERELSYYNWRGSKNLINLNSGGWYVAHIVPVGKEYGKQSLSEIFPNPHRSEWEKSNDKIRHAANVLSPVELKTIQSHFLRMLHPLNSFIIPKRSLVAYNGLNLGEEQELINLVQDYIRSEFPLEYAQLTQLMQIPAQPKVVNSNIGHISWCATEYSAKKKMRNNKATEATNKRMRQQVNKDLYDLDEAEALNNTLKSIGKSVFLKLYPIVRNNPSVTVGQICELLPAYADYSPTSQKTRLSSTRSIINNDLADAALEIIAGSARVKG